MPILASEALLHEKKSSDKMLPLVGIEPGPLIQVQHYPFYTNLTCAA